MRKSALFKRKVPFGMPFWKIRDCGWMIVGKTFCKVPVFHYNSLHLRLLDGVFLPLAIFTLIRIGAWITDTHYLTISKTIALYSRRKWIYLKVPFFYEKVPLKARAPPPNFSLLLTPLLQLASFWLRSGQPFTNLRLRGSMIQCYITANVLYAFVNNLRPTTVLHTVPVFRQGKNSNPQNCSQGIDLWLDTGK